MVRVRWTGTAVIKPNIKAPPTSEPAHQHFESFSLITWHQCLINANVGTEVRWQQVRH